MKRKIFVFLLAIIITGCMLYDLDELLVLRIENTGSEKGDDTNSDDANIVYDCLVDGHIFVNFTINEATCIVAGSETKECIVCDYIENKTIPVNDNHALSTNQNFSKGVKLTSCTNGCGKINNYTFDYKIGDTVNDSAGGVVYYVADGKGGRSLGFTFYNNEADTVGTTAYYLVAALGNFSTAYTWFPSSSNETEIPGTLNGIGSGMKNTRLIIAIMGNPSGDYAAARAYNLKEVDTWFLPSIDELSLLLESKISMLNLDSLNGYWSSSQSSIYESFYFFKNGNNVFIQGIDGYNAKHYIRPIRAF